MAKSKKVRMPAGIRNKLTAAIAMLLVSSIMMVSSTYAWFTLSTAPEVTGITTSVGANGNLEMALLTTETFGDLKLITSAVGDSSATQDVTEANITWGNLVDLSDAGYGLQNINLQPSRLNVAEGATGVASLTSLLKMPVYGKDGRVSELSNETYSTVYDNGWAFDAANQTYGVRAIGANDNLSPQDAGLIAAKTAYSANLKSAQSAVQSALSANGNALASALTALAIDSQNAALTPEQQTAISAMITASASALNYIDAAYKQVLLAVVASQLSDTTAYETAVSTINGAATYADAVAALSGLANGVTVPDVLGGYITELNAQRAAVTQAQTDYVEGRYTTALGALVDTTKVTINGFDSDSLMIDDDGNPDTAKVVNGDFMQAVLDAGGAIVSMPDDSGLFAYVASVAGNYSASCKVNLTQPVTMTANATMQTTANVDNNVATAMNALQAAASAGGATVLSDTFGYALDFAFRTNAAESYLLLQTEGAQRVYSDSQSAATQGAGASMTFTVTTTSAGVATLTNEQVETLMGAIRVGFINPVDSSIKGIAALTDITEGADGFTGDLYLHNYNFDANGVLTLNGVKTEVVDGVDPAAIMKLDQSVATALTVVVWLDGDMVDNADVANAAQSLVGSMNLQFSSSAELIPMQNTALQNMAITYTEMSDTNYAAGLYQYNGTVNVLKDGYKLYNGSDRTTYFSNDETNYTKLTVMNYTTAMTPLTVSVIGNASVEETANITLTVDPSAGTVKSVTWSSGNTEVATVPTDDDTTDDTVVVIGVAKGAAVITANVTLEFGPEGAKVEQTATVNFNLTVAGQTFTVSFNANGGTGNIEAVSVADGDSYTLPTSAEGMTAPEGKVFAGWSYEADGAVIEGTTIIVTTDTELFAIWEDVAQSEPGT